MDPTTKYRHDASQAQGAAVYSVGQCRPVCYAQIGVQAGRQPLYLFIEIPLGLCNLRVAVDLRGI